MTAAASAIRAGRAFVEVFADDRRLARGLKRAQARLKAFGTSVRQIGRTLLLASAALAAPFAVSAKTFASFEQEMARVHALTNATEDEFQRLSDKAKELGEATVFSASQAAEAMSFFALAGFKVEEILSAIGPTLDLAAAGQLEIAEAADISAKIMAGMGLSAGELGRVVDVLTKAMTTANTDLRQLGDAMKYVGPIAKSAGYSLEETVAAVQLLSNAGIQADMAGTTIRGALLSLVDPSAEAKQLLKQLGVQILDVEGNVRPLADIIDDLNGALAGLGGGAKLGIIGRIFDARQAAGFAELMSQGGQRLREATAALENAEGTAARVAGRQLDTLQGDFTILTSALEGLQIAIGEAFGSELRSAIRGITTIVSTTSKWVRANQQVVLSVLKPILLIGVLGAALVSLGVVAQAAAFVFGGLATAAAAIATVLGAVLSPIGLVTTAVAALGGYLVHTSGAGAQALDWLGQTFGRLKDTAVRSFQAISDALAAGDMQLAARVLWTALKMEWQRGINFLGQQWIDAKQFFLDMWNGAIANFSKLLIDAWAGLQTTWIELVDLLADAWTSFTASLTSGWKTAQNFIARGVLRLMRLFDSSLDVEAAEAELSAQLERDQAAIGRDRDRAISERERERQDRVAQIEADRLGATGEIDRMAAQQQLTRERAFDVRRTQSEAELRRAIEDWEAAIAQARTSTTEEESGDQSASEPGRFGQLMSQLQGAGATLPSKAPGVAALSLGSQEGFSAILGALRGGRRSPEEQIEANTAQMAKQQEQTNRKLDRNNQLAEKFARFRPLNLA